MKCARLILAFGFAVGLGTASSEAQEKPNVVLILTDDLGINDLHCYGRADHVTPNLDRLAAQGMRFTSAYCAQPICSASRAALLTGKAPARLHLTTFLPGRPDATSQKLLHPKIRQELPLEEITLAERLKSAGYATACLGKWHLGGAGFGPKQQGFDLYEPGQANTKPSATEGGKGEYGLTASAEAFLDTQADRPFFLYLAHNTPHIPLGAREDLIAKNRDAFNPTYAAMIESLDECVGRVMAKLDALKLTERTIVIFTSDNGGLHVLESPDSPATHNTPFRAGKGFVYEGGLRIPLLVRWPGRIKPGVVETPVMLSDWTPTLTQLAGLPKPDGLDSVSLVPLLTGSGTLPPRTFFWHFPHYTNQGSRPAGAVREGDWKLIEQYDSGRVELYNLADDPSETRDRAVEKLEDVVIPLQKKLKAWRQDVGAQENTPNPDYVPAQWEALYVKVDPSDLPATRRFSELAERLRAWRAGMNEAVRRSQAGAPAKKR